MDIIKLSHPLKNLLEQPTQQHFLISVDTITTSSIRRLPGATISRLPPGATIRRCFGKLFS